MFQRLFIGNKLVQLTSVDSTNSYIKKLLNEHKEELEGLVVSTDNQTNGRGQKGSSWKTDPGKNLTLSIYLKPNILVQNQFLISKVTSLGLVDFLENLGINNVKIKWPNDIYVGSKKIAGTLIENSIKGDKVYNSIVGIGLNVNQVKFDLENNPTSVLKEIGGGVYDLKELFNQLLFFIEKRYMMINSPRESIVNRDYMEKLYWVNETKMFKVKERKVEGIITGVSSIGKLRIKINDKNEEFDLKEIQFIDRIF